MSQESCPNCSAPLKPKAEWCAKCGAITPGTILPAWALIFGLSLMAMCATGVYLMLHRDHFGPAGVSFGALGGYGIKHLVTFFRLKNRQYEQKEPSP